MVLRSILYLGEELFVTEECYFVRHLVTPRYSSAAQARQSAGAAA